MDIEQKYFPIIKTTEAELKGFENLSESVKDSILPIFELTKSRRSKNNPHSDIDRRMEKVAEIIGDRQFILDLTSHDELMNAQIENLLDDDNGFENWVEFLSEYDDLNIIPMIHAYENGDMEHVQNLIKKLESSYGYMAFRIDAFDDETKVYLDEIYASIKNPDNLILIIDAGYIAYGKAEEKSESVNDRIDDISKYDNPGIVVVASSSFPVSVVQHPEGGDSYGNLDMEERILFDLINKEHDLILRYGDYASIHPVRYQIRGGTWVPRVDVPLERSYLYWRFRRDDGGYIRAARAMMEDEDYLTINSWGDEQIELASGGKPNGLSPSFWIAVRLNIHITRQSAIHN